MDSLRRLILIINIYPDSVRTKVHRCLFQRRPDACIDRGSTLEMSKFLILMHLSGKELGKITGLPMMTKKSRVSQSEQKD